MKIRVRVSLPLVSRLVIAFAMFVSVTESMPAQTCVDGGACNPSSLDNTIMADQQTGADACIKIHAALALLPSTGGTVDARGFQGIQTCSANPWNSITAPATLLLGHATFQAVVQWNPTRSSQMTKGLGQQATIIQAAAGFPSNSSDGSGCVVRIGSTNGSGAVDDTRFESLTVFALTSDQNSCAAYSENMNEGSGFVDFGFGNFNQNGIYINGSGGTIVGDFTLENLNGNPNSGAQSSGYMIYLYKVGDKTFISNLTCGSSKGTQQEACVEVYESTTNLSTIHCENFLYCVNFDSGSWGSAVEVVGKENNVSYAVDINSYGTIFLSGIANGTGIPVHNATTVFTAATGDVIGTYISGSPSEHECYFSQQSAGEVCTGNFAIKGNLTVNGTKSSVVPLHDGRVVALYAVESPENWFEDLGTTHLRNGATTVVIDSNFLQTVDTKLPYRVFVTPNGQCRGLYVAKKSATQFEVREIGGGKSNVSFDYRIIATRQGFGGLRLDEVPDKPTTEHRQ
jgi:hypothetical protein